MSETEHYRTLTERVQRKLLPKLALLLTRSPTLHSFEWVFSAETRDNFHQLQQLVKGYDVGRSEEEREEEADKLLTNFVVVVVKVAVLYSNDCFSTQDYLHFKEYLSAKVAFFQTLVNYDKDPSEALYISRVTQHVWNMRGSAMKILQSRFSNKTVRRAMTVFDFMDDKALYTEYLFKEGRFEPFREMVTRSIEDTKVLIEATEKKQSGSDKVLVRVKDLFAGAKKDKLSSFGKVHPYTPTFLAHNSDDKVFGFLSNLFLFVESETASTEQAEEMISCLCGMAVNLNLGYTVDLYTEEDQANLFVALSNTRGILDYLLSLRDWDDKHNNPAEVAAQVELMRGLFEETTDRMIAVFKPYFGEEQLEEVRKVFYYFSKISVIEHFIKDSGPSGANLATQLRMYYSSLTNIVLCES